MEWINFKVKDGERERIKKDAYSHEKNISEYLRWLIEKQRKEYENDGTNTRKGNGGSVRADTPVDERQ